MPDHLIYSALTTPKLPLAALTSRKKEQ